MRHIVLALVCVFTLMFTGAAMAADMVDNPAYTMWAKYKTGTSVTYSQDMDMGMMKMQMEMTQTLAEVTPDQVVVEATMKNSMMPGGGQKHRVTHPAKIEKDKADTQGKMPEGMKGEVKQLGTEAVKVGDKEYTCKVAQFTGEQRGMKCEGKTWNSDEIPSSIVKMEMSGTAGEQGTMKMTMLLKSVEIK